MLQQYYSSLQLLAIKLTVSKRRHLHSSSRLHYLGQGHTYKEYPKVTQWICHNDPHLRLAAKLTYFEECNFLLEKKYFHIRSSSANIRFAVSVVPQTPSVMWLVSIPSSAGLIRGRSPMRRPFRMLLTQEVGFYVGKYRRCSTDRFPYIIAYPSLSQNKDSARLHITNALATYVSARLTQCQRKYWSNATSRL